MLLNPQAKAFLDQREAAGAQPLHTLSVDEARRQMNALSALLGPGEPVAHVEDRLIAGPDGAIPIRIYMPHGGGPFAGLVYFHGGGWVLGNLETVDVSCRMLTNRAQCIVVSVNYRHAPEHKFPAAADDAYAATRWVAEHALGLNIDPARVAVGGSSAGGNLAAAVALMARERGAPPLAFQLLTVPVTDYAFGTESYRANADGYGLTKDGMVWFWNHYLRSEADGSNPVASPLRAADLSGLPPAFVMTAEYDPLRDEGEAYAARLRAAGVPVAHKRYEGMIHGFLGAQATDDAAEQLRAAFAR
ncbi:MAG: alpha/beta hydrolase [Chloroflexi bacterium]|nr:alpha/beta hydrolase [Chloroflexota bacterium]